MAGGFLPVVLAPGERDYNQIEDRQKDHGDGMRERETVDLITDKSRQNDDHRRVGP